MAKSWKATLRLPVSSFPARPNPKLRQQHLRDCTDGLYQWQAASRPRDDPFVLHDGPPYANGPLHIGHAANKILKDVILRAQVQAGRRVVYRPGWDCHGLPIEIKALGHGAAKGMSPVKVRESARRLATKTVADHIKGFQSFAVMADWDNRWTTMDRDFEIRQLRVFQSMARRGLIYRKRKPVYWSVSSRTALAEAELEYRDDHVSRAAYVKFPITSDCSSVPELAPFAGRLYAAAWTTTPWTLPANRAIAVHHHLPYSVLRVADYALLVASSRVEAVGALLPDSQVAADGVPGERLAGLAYRNKLRGVHGPDQPIVHADFVSADSGTGLVHMAPGHGQDDYEVCSRLGIDAFAPIDDDGFFTADAYPDRPELLTSAPSILDGGADAVLGLMGDDVLATHDVCHSYPYDWRTKKPVVVRATAQWFADVGSIKEASLEALAGVRFVPESGRARLESFIKGRSEWCISRQRSWGVPIPALYDAGGEPVMTDESVEHIISLMAQRSSDAWFSDEPDEPAWMAPSLRGPHRRGTDTMDVWFDSGTSWTEIGRPVDVYLEGSDQHRGWFQSSLLTYVAAQEVPEGATGGRAVPPFGTLITHGFALDAQGKKMSKSLGNTVAPEEVMNGTLLPAVRARGKAKAGDGPRFDALGPDALRLWATSSDFTTDMLIGPSMLQPVHNALIKYRTVLKMILGSLHPSARRARLTKLDQMALLQLSQVMKQSRDAVDKFEFHRAASLINRWVATDLSAFYLEALKDRLYCGDGGGALEPILVGFLRMLAPVTPVLVEEAWAHRPTWMAEDDSLQHPARQLFDAPLVDPSRLTVDAALLRRDMPTLAAVREAVNAALEQARKAKALGSSLQCCVVISTEDGAVEGTLRAYMDELDTMLVVSHVELNAPLPEAPAWLYSSRVEMQGQTRATVHVLPPKLEKCSRCWRYVVEQGDGVCVRCADVVGASGAAA